MECLTGQPLRISTGNQSCHARNILGKPYTTQRRPFGKEILNLLGSHILPAWNILGRIVIVHISFDSARCNHIDGDIARTKVYRKTFCHTENGCLGRGVNRVSGDALRILS